MDQLANCRSDNPVEEPIDEQGPAALVLVPSAADQSDERLDFFIHRDGQTYAGTHLIIDLIDAERLDGEYYISTCRTQTLANKPPGLQNLPPPWSPNLVGRRRALHMRRLDLLSSLERCQIMAPSQTCPTLWLPSNIWSRADTA